MNKDWHSSHFSCWQCDESLTGQRYVLREEHPYCVKCYESLFANNCEQCEQPIGIDYKVSSAHYIMLSLLSLNTLGYLSSTSIHIQEEKYVFR